MQIFNTALTKKEYFNRFRSKQDSKAINTQRVTDYGRIINRNITKEREQKNGNRGGAGDSD